MQTVFVFFVRVKNGRNISKNSLAKAKSRSRSVKSHGSSMTRVGGKPNLPKSVNEQMALQNI